jgi:hypothetical protein
MSAGGWTATMRRETQPGSRCKNIRMLVTLTVERKAKVTVSRYGLKISDLTCLTCSCSNCKSKASQVHRWLLRCAEIFEMIRRNIGGIDGDVLFHRNDFSDGGHEIFRGLVLVDGHNKESKRYDVLD